jgi:tetratricopeptide (TPR) repeat protein
MSAAIDMVRWEDRALGRIPLAAVRQQLSAELMQLFRRDGVDAVVVHDVFPGFRNEPAAKAVLGLQTLQQGQFQSHIVKIGNEDEVGRDFEGWRECVERRNVSSLLLVPVTSQPLSPAGHPPVARRAVVYKNAYHLFGFNPGNQTPVSWQSAAMDAVRIDTVATASMASIERVVIEIFSELNEWFYSSATYDNRKAGEFYATKFARVKHLWDADPLASPLDPGSYRAVLRADAVWLLSGRDLPETPERPRYLDPFDYICHELPGLNEVAAGGVFPGIPQTLVGPTHGDLHGENILIGVLRGEARSPVLYDYGEMSPHNVVAWDFAKLEMELKTRLLPWFIAHDAEARAALLSVSRCAPKLEFVPDAPPAELDRSRRAHRLAWLFEIEHILARESRRIDDPTAAADREPPSQRELIPGRAALNRLLCLLLRIRQEAALVLGSHRPGSFGGWRDEYYFALAVYGLMTAKWSTYHEPQTESALVSSGVACTELPAAQILHERDSIPVRPVSQRFVSYRIPLFLAHQAWQRKDYDRALAILNEAQQHFPRCVPLKAEVALNLAARGEMNRALEIVQPFRSLCRVFGDHETLTRIGRCLKELADQRWQDCHSRNVVPDMDLIGQLYREAYKVYREAYEVNQNYFPGINAATLALLSGEPQSVVNELACSVEAQCRNADVSGPDRYWLFATGAEAALIQGRVDVAAARYLLALQELTPQTVEQAQTAWNQVCRIGHHTGLDLTPIVDAFLSVDVVRRHLDVGPFQYCSSRFPNRPLLNEARHKRLWVIARKTAPVWAVLLREGGRVDTTEGTVAATAGEYLCRGINGEEWPQPAPSFARKYVPTDEVDQQGWRKYVPNPDSSRVFAAAIHHDFRVETCRGDMFGAAGDYLVKSIADGDVMYPDDVWIVDKTVFGSTYSIDN